MYSSSDKNKNFDINTFAIQSNLDIPNVNIDFSTHTINNHYLDQVKYMIEQIDLNTHNNNFKCSVINCLYKSSSSLRKKSQIVMDSESFDPFNEEFKECRDICKYSHDTVEYLDLELGQVQEVVNEVVAQNYQEKEKEQEHELISENIIEHINTDMLKLVSNYEYYKFNDFINSENPATLDSNITYNNILLKFPYSNNLIMSRKFFYKYIHLQNENNDKKVLTTYNIIFNKRIAKFIILTQEEYIQISSYYYFVKKCVQDTDYQIELNIDHLMINIDHNKLLIPGLKSLIEFMSDTQISDTKDGIYMINHLIPHTRKNMESLIDLNYCAKNSNQAVKTYKMNSDLLNLVKQYITNPSLDFNSYLAETADYHHSINNLISTYKKGIDDIFLTYHHNEYLREYHNNNLIKLFDDNEFINITPRIMKFYDMIQFTKLSQMLLNIIQLQEIKENSPVDYKFNMDIFFPNKNNRIFLIEVNKQILDKSNVEYQNFSEKELDTLDKHNMVKSILELPPIFKSIHSDYFNNTINNYTTHNLITYYNLFALTKIYKCNVVIREKTTTEIVAEFKHSDTATPESGIKTINLSISDLFIKYIPETYEAHGGNRKNKYRYKLVKLK